ncbi:hypothetical protein CR513_01826, partial [Mucuna pruriens]
MTLEKSDKKIGQSTYRDKLERKSIRGGCHLIGANLVSWSSKRQGTIAMITQFFQEPQVVDPQLVKEFEKSAYVEDTMISRKVVGVEVVVDIGTIAKAIG